MTIEDIRKNAPVGAKYYMLHDCLRVTYYKIGHFGESLRFSKNECLEIAHCNVLKHPMIKPLN